MADYEFSGTIGEDEADLFVMAAIGDNLERALRDKTSAFGAMMTAARAEFLDSIAGLVSVDLFTDDGIKAARLMQNHVQRYRDLCRYIKTYTEDAEHAQAALEEEGDGDAVAELIQQMKGSPDDQPAPDA